MKTTLAALAISACMLGISTAASHDEAKNSASARQASGKHLSKADRKMAKHGKEALDPEARK